MASKHSSYAGYVYGGVMLAVLAIAVRLAYPRSSPVCPSVGRLTVHPHFEPVVKVFEKNIKSGYELGASFAVYKDGKPLVDIWGGCSDLSAAKDWKQDTLTQAWSSTKGVTGIVFGQLIDRGRLSYKDKVAHHWPEFAANGKENITVAMLLSHQAGLSNLPNPIPLRDYVDNWPKVEELMAKQTPLWEPGKRYSYHAFTFGMYANALIRRVDEKNRSITQYFQEEIATPFGLDFYIGLPKEMDGVTTQATYESFWRLAAGFVARPASWPIMHSIMWHSRLMYDAMHAVDAANDFYVFNRADMREVGLSSCNGFGTARSLARLYDYVANNGTVQGRSVLSPHAVEVLATPATLGVPAIVGPDYPFSSVGMAVEMNRHGQPTVGHRGYGGQFSYGDRQHRVGVSYLTNNNHGMGDIEDPRHTELVDTLYQCLETFQQ